MQVRDLAWDPPRASPSLKELISRRKRKTKRTAMLRVQNKVDLSITPVEGGLLPLQHYGRLPGERSCSADAHG